MFKIVGMKKKYFIALALIIVCFILVTIVYANSLLTILLGLIGLFSKRGDVAAEVVKESFTGGSVFFLFLILAMLWLLVISWKHVNALSKAFGHGSGFALGLLLLPCVFNMILGFNEDQFNKPKEVL